METPTVDGLFATGDGDRRLALKCWGAGSPTIIYDAGTDDTGIGGAQSSPVVRDLAARTKVCSYDRAGIGASDPAPSRKRYLDDVVDDLDGILGAAKVDPPYLLVGSSGGGFDVYHHAGRHPEDVVGLVMLDVPAGQANISPSDVPAWDSADNPEHMDYAAVERQMALHRLRIGPIPVTVVTASEGQSADPEDQRVWLEGSSKPVQVVLDGGHDVFHENPDAVLAEIQKILEPTSPDGAPASELVGEWQRETTCEDRVRALTEAGLGEFAAEHAAGEGWIPGVSRPDQLQDPRRPCLGAVPLTHSHFFTEDGLFGSRDDAGSQVDDGTYQLADDHTLVVAKEFGEVTFTFEIRGDELFLDPVLPTCVKKGCFAAQWAVSVAYPGLAWERTT